MGRGPRRCLLSCIIFAVLATAKQSANDRPSSIERTVALESLGRKMFFDPSLSASGKLSCAVCHDPAFAYGPPNALSVQQGGISGQEWGLRAVPSLRYLQAIPQFTEHRFDEETGDDSVDNGPSGGLTWDGRVDRGREQARIPLLSQFEMANRNEASVVAAALKASYSNDLKTLSGAGSDTKRVFETILEAFEVWEENYREFYPYSSKYDAWLAGKAKLTEGERRGLQLFKDPAKGNCARCHIADRGASGTPPQFTDYGLIALGVPRNGVIPANADPGWYDLGVCGPLRTDLTGKSEYCGRFMTPSLRNAARRHVFFHNGVIHSLREAVAFYANRDSDAKQIDDLPAQYRNNLETEAPFGRPKGSSPVLTDPDIDYIVEFLRTLTDGFKQAP